MAMMTPIHDLLAIMPGTRIQGKRIPCPLFSRGRTCFIDTAPEGSRKASEEALAAFVACFDTLTNLTIDLDAAWTELLDLEPPDLDPSGVLVQGIVGHKGLMRLELGYKAPAPYKLLAPKHRRALVRCLSDELPSCAMKFPYMFLH